MWILAPLPSLQRGKQPCVMGGEGSWCLGGAGARSVLGEQWGVVDIRKNMLNFRRDWQMRADLAFVEDVGSLTVNICV